MRSKLASYSQARKRSPHPPGITSNRQSATNNPTSRPPKRSPTAPHQRTNNMPNPSPHLPEPDSKSGYGVQRTTEPRLGELDTHTRDRGKTWDVVHQTRTRPLCLCMCVSLCVCVCVLTCHTHTRSNDIRLPSLAYEQRSGRCNKLLPKTDEAQRERVWAKAVGSVYMCNALIARHKRSLLSRINRDDPTVRVPACTAPQRSCCSLPGCRVQ